ncbi:hypothetical protein [Pseudobacteriovorax antillogorgiicola]|uniref:Lipoprotein n=1 Tax=Pseudobacteriovorax antillogorgiicola TaxID=1513793 RepID=A0A1Y6BI22_9BACT|nr:hypothetical protein [Pseudobacteriovorax antillogorgiicola]TCS57336.1 hypothetical protein EDD56_10376 [Pseudobacteriovorax antillogorgiicola]SMF02355.1 hypothetical protein SAMN06296036_103257 [Pseudobacteriovorax antillogorgiicola]
MLQANTYGALLSCYLIILGAAACGFQDFDDIEDFIEVSGSIDKDTTWSSSKEYLLIGQAFVQSGVTLTIEPGTTIRSIASDVQGLAPALIIKPGATIIANGTAEQPITFTSSTDDANLPARGLWGGLIILGQAPVNASLEKRVVEGVAGVSYGGDDAEDSSGILRYVRIWYGGRNIGENNEINGLTLAGVGRGTTIEHIEVAWNQDDGVEFFGGTVDAKYVSVLFVRDDAIDTDLGYQGRLQHIFTLAGRDLAGRAFEMDNDGSNYDASPRSFPIVCNATLLGPTSSIPEADLDEDGDNVTDQGDQMIRLREGTGGDFRNIAIQDGNGVCMRVSDSRTQEILSQVEPTEAGNTDLLYVSSNIFGSNCGGSTVHSSNAGALTLQELDPLLTTVNIDANNQGSLDPRPQSSSPLLGSQIDSCRSDGWFDATEYSGAFSGTDNWLSGWSWLSEHGFLD